MTYTSELNSLLIRAIDAARDAHDDQQIIRGAEQTLFHFDVGDHFENGGTKVRYDVENRRGGLSVVIEVEKTGRSGFLFWFTLWMDAVGFEDEDGFHGYTFDELRRSEIKIVRGGKHAEAWAIPILDGLRDAAVAKRQVVA